MLGSFPDLPPPTPGHDRHDTTTPSPSSSPPSMSKSNSGLNSASKSGSEFELVAVRLVGVGMLHDREDGDENGERMELWGREKRFEISNLPLSLGRAHRSSQILSLKKSNPTTNQQTLSKVDEVYIPKIDNSSFAGPGSELMSRKHAEISPYVILENKGKVEGKESSQMIKGRKVKVMIWDLGSTHGTRVDGKIIPVSKEGKTLGAVELFPSSIITFGKSVERPRSTTTTSEAQNNNNDQRKQPQEMEVFHPIECRVEFEYSDGKVIKELEEYRSLMRRRDQEVEVGGDGKNDIKIPALSPPNKAENNQRGTLEGPGCPSSSPPLVFPSSESDSESQSGSSDVDLDDKKGNQFAFSWKVRKPRDKGGSEKNIDNEDSFAFSWKIRNPRNEEGNETNIDGEEAAPVVSPSSSSSSSIIIQDRDQDQDDELHGFPTEGENLRAGSTGETNYGEWDVGKETRGGGGISYGLMEDDLVISDADADGDLDEDVDFNPAASKDVQEAQQVEGEEEEDMMRENAGLAFVDFPDTVTNFISQSKDDDDDDDDDAGSLLPGHYVDSGDEEILGINHVLGSLDGVIHDHAANQEGLDHRWEVEIEAGQEGGPEIQPIHFEGPEIEAIEFGRTGDGSDLNGQSDPYWDGHIDDFAWSNSQPHPQIQSQPHSDLPTPISITSTSITPTPPRRPTSLPQTEGSTPCPAVTPPRITTDSLLPSPSSDYSTTVAGRKHQRFQDGNEYDKEDGDQEGKLIIQESDGDGEKQERLVVVYDSESYSKHDDVDQDQDGKKSMKGVAQLSSASESQGFSWDNGIPKPPSPGFLADRSRTQVTSSDDSGIGIEREVENQDEIGEEREEEEDTALGAGAMLRPEWLKKHMPWMEQSGSGPGPEPKLMNQDESGKAGNGDGASGMSLAMPQPQVKETGNPRVMEWVEGMEALLDAGHAVNGVSESRVESMLDREESIHGGNSQRSESGSDNGGSNGNKKRKRVDLEGDEESTQETKGNPLVFDHIFDLPTQMDWQKSELPSSFPCASRSGKEPDSQPLQSPPPEFSQHEDGALNSQNKSAPFTCFDPSSSENQSLAFPDKRLLSQPQLMGVEPSMPASPTSSLIPNVGTGKDLKVPVGPPPTKRRRLFDTMRGFAAGSVATFGVLLWLGTE